MAEDATDLDFETVTLAALAACSPGELDDLPYGVVGLTAEARVGVYNATEARLAGIKADGVIGTHFFTGTAQCMNNFMVAQRFEDEPRIETTIDYVLTFRMRPTPVRLRLLKEPGEPMAYLLVLRI